MFERRERTCACACVRACCVSVLTAVGGVTCPTRVYRGPCGGTGLCHITVLHVVLCFIASTDFIVIYNYENSCM